ncbi:hypothetical protein Pr1d_20950 [Bythopirellula goksoeyrii]|uniref:Uncharacterized protein n=1 Tax=Bythopirellula goksoeyrii TaxID=1400387 RepID=A0A5B9QB77_9BACT|nr:hypothetical protein Pr1d_20950 [Bythopirellula goksoeyrii]
MTLPFHENSAWVPILAIRREVKNGKSATGSKALALQLEEPAFNTKITFMVT